MELTMTIMLKVVKSEYPLLRRAVKKIMDNAARLSTCGVTEGGMVSLCRVLRRFTYNVTAWALTIEEAKALLYLGNFSRSSYARWANMTTSEILAIEHVWELIDEAARDLAVTDGSSTDARC